MSRDDAAGSSDASVTREPAERLLVRVIEVLEAQGPEAVEPLLQQHPDDAPFVRSFLQRLRGLGLLEAPQGAKPAVPERLGDYRLVEPIGQGGMGIVYRAVQESLGREVALKVIRPDLLLFAGSRERFRREVETVARMQHPGIVPVHGVGEDDGLPYFAMEFVRGASLADVTRRLQGRRPSELRGSDMRAAIVAHIGEVEPGPEPEFFRGSWNQVVLRIAREVAEAVEHAHRRGVLHRDIKPSNVMLTAGGRVLLLDFGLAGSDSGDSLTRSGSLLGSLAYMAPELLRATGQHSTDTDVYALGVTCWELLALELPYHGSDPISLLHQVEGRSRPRLSLRNQSVGWEIETVLATAMDSEPRRRYATASQFSRDLDNVLNRRPIEAREPGVGLRLRRWLQRHPALATGLVAALLVAAGVPSALAWQQRKARVRIEAEADHAKANFDRLQQAVDTMLVEVGDSSLRDVPRMEVVRRKLLEQALQFYEGFVAEQPDEPRFAVEVARVRLRLAEVLALLGDYARSVEQVAKGLAVLAQHEGHDAAVRREIARAQSRLATGRRLSGDLDGAAAAAEQALASWRALAPDAGRARDAGAYGRTVIEAALIAVDRGRLEDAIAAVEQLLSTIDGWRQGHANDAWLQQLEAKARDWLGVWIFQLAMQTRDRKVGLPLAERAADLHRRAQQLWQSLLAGAPASQVRADASQNGVSLSIVLQQLGQPEQAEQALAEAVRIGEDLVRDFPASQRRRAELGNALGNHASLLGMLGRTEESLAGYEAARRIWAQLTSESPDNDEYWIGLAFTLQGTCAHSFYSGKAGEGVPTIAAAADACERALAVRPDNPSYRRVRRKIAETRATLCLMVGDIDRAAASARVLVDARCAPVEPALAAALLARCSHAQAAAGGDAVAEAAAMLDEARSLLRQAIDGGRSIAQLRQDRSLAGQWDQHGFAELVAEFEGR